MARMESGAMMAIDFEFTAEFPKPWQLFVKPPF
jgi:hypothetical protein